MLKKVLALLLTLTLVLSMGVTAFAASEKEITGEGDTTYVDTDKFEVILPTDNNWDFVLDPQGLIGAYKAGLFAAGATAGVTAAQLSPYVGKIIAGDYAPVAVNLSSYKVTLGVDIKIGGDAITVATSGVLEADDKNNILINALLSDSSVTDPVATFGVTNPVTIPLTAAEQTLGFVLNAPQYVYNTVDGVDFTYDLADGEDGYGTQIQLGGLVNKTADWSAFKSGGTKEVTVTSKFNLTQSTEEELALPLVNPNAYGYVGPLSRAIAVELLSATPNGEANVTTSTKIDLVFDEDIDLVDGDVTINDDVGEVTAGTLTQGVDKKNWSIALDSVTTAGAVDVNVSATGYAITGSPATVTVYKYTAPPVKLLSGPTGNTELTTISVVTAGVVAFRIDGITGVSADKFTSLIAGGMQLNKGAHYSVAVGGDGLLAVTFIGNGWFTTAKAGTDDIKATIDGTEYTFNVVMQ